MVVPAQSSTPPAAAWGGSAEGPKKTLKQIQEEEERRKNKHDAQIRAAQVTAGTAQTKRGYADLAAHATPSPAQVAAAAAQGWTTVGAAGKAATATTTASPKPAAAPVVAKAVVQPKPAAAAVSAAPTVPKPIAKAANGSDDPNQPSVEFIHWTKKSLDGLTVNVDEFIQMLLTFPIDPPSSDRNQVLEIIADSVYSSSRTLDGRRFAQEFFTKRKADAQRNATRPVQKITSLADVLKTQPKAPAADVGFKVVKAKKNRRN
jgi:PERQ amino acid-rich with GYF domain-containing protein